MPDYSACQIEQPFADGTYLFRLHLPQIAELQAKCEAGIGTIFARVLKGRYVRGDGSSFGSPAEAGYCIHDLTETIRLALIGGGKGVVDGQPIDVDPVTARHLVDDYATPPARPLKEAWTLAAAILAACCEGYEDPEAEPPKKDQPTTSTAASTTPAP